MRTERRWYGSFLFVLPFRLSYFNFEVALRWSRSAHCAGYHGMHNEEHMSVSEQKAQRTWLLALRAGDKRLSR